MGRGGLHEPRAGKMEGDGAFPLLRPQRRIEREPDRLGAGTEALLQPIGDGKDDPPGRAVGIDGCHGDGARGRRGCALLQRSKSAPSRQHRAGKGKNADQAGGRQRPSRRLHSPSHRDQSVRGMSSVGVVMDV